MRKIACILVVGCIMLAVIGCASATQAAKAAEQPAAAAAPAAKQEAAPAVAAQAPKQEAAPAAAPAPSVQGVLFEGFENDLNFWIPVRDQWKDGDNSTEAQMVDKNPSEGKMSLEGSFTWKTTSWATFEAEQPLINNWNGVKAVAVDVFIPGDKPLKMQFAVCSGSTWLWQQCKEVVLQSGWNPDVPFDLMDVASPSNNWQFTGTALVDAKSIMRVVLRVGETTTPPSGGEGTVYFDNIRLIK